MATIFKEKTAMQDKTSYGFPGEPLYVISVIFNPHRYTSRMRLYEQFKEYMLNTKNVILYTVECSFGERESIIQDINESNHVVLKVQTSNEIWLKENLINIAVQRLPADWKYMAWIDADVSFARHDWATETVQQLQHYDVVQMFSHAQDLDKDEIPYQTHQSFAYNFCNDDLEEKNNYNYTTGNKWHPGFAWAIKRKAFDSVGGLMDFPILGAADNHMAWSIIGKGAKTIPQGISDGYKSKVLLWEKRALKGIKKNIGYVPGLLVHYFHGSKKYRKYADRWEILVKNNFNPETDLIKDWQGLYCLETDCIDLKKDCRNYFKQRNEDCIFLDDKERKL